MSQKYKLCYSFCIGFCKEKELDTWIAYDIFNCSHLCPLVLFTQDSKSLKIELNWHNFLRIANLEQLKAQYSKNIQYNRIILLKLANPW